MSPPPCPLGGLPWALQLPDPNLPPPPGLSTTALLPCPSWRLVAAGCLHSADYNGTFPFYFQFGRLYGTCLVGLPDCPQGLDQCLRHNWSRYSTNISFFCPIILFFLALLRYNGQIKLSDIYLIQCDLISIHIKKGFPHSINQHTQPLTYLPFFFFLNKHFSSEWKNQLVNYWKMQPSFPPSLSIDESIALSI